jgi:hypothetical protein
MWDKDGSVWPLLSASLELLQVSVTCMEPVGPERRDTNLHPEELLSLIRFVQPVV